MIFKFLAKLIAPSRPISDSFKGPANDPIGRIFQGDPSALYTPGYVEYRERTRASELAKRRKRVEAINFLTRGLHTLADAHVKALKEANAAPSRAQLRNLEDFISRGHKSLLMQADLLYGSKTVDDALRECDYEPRDFRTNAFA